MEEKMKKMKKPFEGLVVGDDPIRSLKSKLGKICEINKLNEIDLIQGNPTGKISREYAVRMRHLIDLEELGISLSNAYTSSQGYLDFLIAISKFEKRINGIDITSNHILAVPGAGEGISTLLCGLMETSKGGQVILLAPFFPPYRAYVEHSGFVPRIIKLELDENLLLNKINENIDENTRALIINSPNNPSGQIYSKNFLIKLGKLLNKNNHILVISDEPYRELVLPGEIWNSVVENMNYENTAIVYSFSKEGRIAGSRIGYIALHPHFPNYEEVINALTNTLTERGIIQASTREQMALSLCKLPLDVDWTDSMNLLESLSTDLVKIGYEIIKPQGGLFICVKSPNKVGQDLHERLIQKGLGTVPGKPFSIEEYVRMTICGVTAENYDEILNRFRNVYLTY